MFRQEVPTPYQSPPRRPDPTSRSCALCDLGDTSAPASNVVAVRPTRPERSGTSGTSQTRNCGDNTFPNATKTVTPATNAATSLSSLCRATSKRSNDCGEGARVGRSSTPRRPRPGVHLQDRSVPVLPRPTSRRKAAVCQPREGSTRRTTRCGGPTGLGPNAEADTAKSYGTERHEHTAEKARRR
jgi:hypothetical protein